MSTAEQRADAATEYAMRCGQARWQERESNGDRMRETRRRDDLEEIETRRAFAEMS